METEGEDDLLASERKKEHEHIKESNSSPTRQRHTRVPAEIVHWLTLVHLKECAIRICRGKN